jgi:L-ascorbate metabolism protein UlaG (beta-lactamase superfamily)
MTIALLVFAGIIFFILVMGAALSAPGYKGPVSDHFDGKKFFNLDDVKPQNLRGVLKWMLNRHREKWDEFKPENFTPKRSSEVDPGIRVTFINHSTFLIQVDGINILTDPIWSERAGPFSWIGPKRKRPPGVQIEDLPRIDFILLSHNHYDHLDVGTLRQISAKHQPVIFTSLGIKAFLERKGIPGSVEMDWWDEIPFKEMIIQSVPAQHFSARGTLDRDRTLWCGFVIKRNQGNIYFAADTGYNEKIFRKIAERCGPIDLAFIPIGAYKPIWFMAPVHVSPEEAVKMHQLCKARVSIAMHFGTFALGDENPESTLYDLGKSMQTENISQDSFRILKEGITETI